MSQRLAWRKTGGPRGGRVGAPAGRGRKRRTSAACVVSTATLKPAKVARARVGAPAEGDDSAWRKSASRGHPQTGQGWGRPSVHAPEQARGQKGRGDLPPTLWALGAVLVRSAGRDRNTVQGGEGRSTRLAMVIEGSRSPRDAANGKVPANPPVWQTIRAECLHKQPRTGARESAGNGGTKTVGTGGEGRRSRTRNGGKEGEGGGEVGGEQKAQTVGPR